jgi:SAM-dependent methyltransferase
VKEFDFHIHPDDEMFGFLLGDGYRLSRAEAFSNYMSVGYTISLIIRHVLNRLGVRLSDESFFLDFASGYGRTTRFLIQHLRPERVFVSDLHAQAVAYQTERFGCKGFVSVERPADLAEYGPFDVITCISLFSHLPRPLFRDWLHKLTGMLKRDGVLIFTTHPLEKTWEEGHSPFSGEQKNFVFSGVSESSTISPSVYGTAFVSREFVEKAVSSISGRAILAYLPRGLHNHQDIYAVGADIREFVEIKNPSIPIGCIESVEIEGDRVRISGWAYDPAIRGPAKEVFIHVRGSCVGRCRLGGRRDDVAAYVGDPGGELTGFECYLTHSYASGDVLCVELKGDSSSNILFYRENEFKTI